MDFVAGNSNKLQNLGLEGKISWALNVCVFTPSKLEIFNPENVKNKKNVFTLGPMAQATLVCIKTKNSQIRSPQLLTLLPIKLLATWIHKLLISPNTTLWTLVKYLLIKFPHFLISRTTCYPIQVKSFQICNSIINY